MKLLILASIVLLLASCSSPSWDSSLPVTDTELFIEGSTIRFPRGTSAADVYNTVTYIFPDNEWHNVTDGQWNRIITTYVDDLPQQTWEIVPFTRIRHDIQAVKTHPNNTGYVYTHTVFLYGSDSIREIFWQWQTFNVTQKTVRRNEPIEGDITFIF